MFKWLSKWFQRDPKNPKQGDVYAVLRGRYVGELFVYVGVNDDKYHFMSIPVMENRKVPIVKFDLGLESGIIEFVERLKRNERLMCIAQFDNNEKT